MPASPLSCVRLLSEVADQPRGGEPLASQPALAPDKPATDELVPAPRGTSEGADQKPGAGGHDRATSPSAPVPGTGPAARCIEHNQSLDERASRSSSSKQALIQAK